MNPEIREYIARSDYYQGGVRELAKQLPIEDSALDALIAETVAESDQEVFIYVVMAALCSGRPVQARHLARGTALMPEKLTLGVIASHVAGDIAGPLLEAVTNLGLQVAEVASTALYLAAKWHEEHGERRIPAKLVAAARIATRNPRNTPYDLWMLHAIAAMSGDEGLKALTLEKIGLKAGDPRLKHAEKDAQTVGEQMLRVWRRPPIEVLREAPDKALATGNTMRRAVARTGRNDPCPCGSGRKYKQCCIDKDQERLHHSTSFVGVTEAELRANRERYLTVLDFESLPAHETARLDPLKLAPDLVEPYLANMCRGKLLEGCVAALEKLGYSDKLNEPFHQILLRVAQARRKDLADRMLKLPPDPSKIRSGDLQLFFAEEDPAKLVQIFRQDAMTVVSCNTPEMMRGYPRTLLKSSLCALGILVARGVIPLLPPAEAAALLEDLLVARDKLHLSPDDPIGEVLDRLSVEQRDEGKDAAGLREVQSRLQGKMQEVQRYREAVERLEKELVRREKQAAAPVAPAPPPDEAALKEMRQKVNTLKSALKERHNERNELRRELQKVQADLELLRQKTVPLAVAGGSAEEADAEEDLLLPQEGDGNQPLRLIEFPHGFQQTLEKVPRHVARGALSMIGRLAGAEPAAFVGAVRLKACPSITRQRIGIDHRLLFRLLPDRVQVVDLIPRQDLERRIKTLV